MVASLPREKLGSYDTHGNYIELIARINRDVISLIQTLNTMNDSDITFQSNRAVSTLQLLYYNSYMSSGHLPPSMQTTELCELWCLLEGKKVPFGVIVDVRQSMNQLKKRIKEETEVLRNVETWEIILWKPVNPVTIKPVDTLFDRLPQFPSESFVELKEPTDTISSYFPQGVPKECLHVIVRRPASETNKDEHPTKRRRQNEELLAIEESVIAFWRDLWIAGKNPIHQETVQRDPDCLEDVDVAATFDVLHGLPVAFTKGGILIRSEYKLAEEGIESHGPHVNAVVIVGHPGIGKSSFLFYLLARRLLARKPTIFQRDASSIYFFSATGVQRLFRDTLHESVESSKTWALLDAKQEDKTAPIFLTDRSDLFLVIASSPRPSHWRDVERYRPRVEKWFMEPFGLEELIQARQLQLTKCSEASIQQFLREYGPSARDCYAFCESIPYYHSQIRDRVKKIAWSTVTDMLTARTGAIGLDDGSHQLVLVRPSPTDRSFPSLSIITKTVARLLHERDSDARWQNARKLYRTLRADPQTRSSAGKLLEPAFHALCMKGTSFRLSSMNMKPGGRTRDTFTNDSANHHATLTLPPQPRTVFDREHPITTLLANHYYQPSHGTQPSYDSFIFNPEEATFILFQVTCGLIHPVLLKGINALIDLAVQLGVNNPTVCFVAVVPEGDRVEFPVPKDRGFVLQMFCIEVTENELYD